MPELKDIASTLRSKNAEPFITCCDIFIKEEADYRWLKDSELITAETVARLYGMPREAVFGIYFIDNVQAVKVSFFKTAGGKYIAAGDLETIDMAGTQQHIPLLHMKIPEQRRPADAT